MPTSNPKESRFARLFMSLAAAIVLAIAVTACQSSATGRSDCEAALERRVELAVDDSVSRADEHRQQIAAAVGKSFIEDCESRTGDEQKRIAVCLQTATSRDQANRCL